MGERTLVTHGVSRRDVVKAGLAGGLVLALHLPLRAANEPEQALDDTVGQFAPSAFIRIDHTGKTTLVMPQVEMGSALFRPGKSASNSPSARSSLAKPVSSPPITF
jgi:hypothetical protein